MSQRQVLQELMQMEVADMAFYDEDDDDSTVPAGSAQGRPHPGSIRRVPAAAGAAAAAAAAPSQNAVSPLQSFWVEQGLAAHVAHGIAKDMVEAQSRFCDVTQLAVQVQRLGRIIPGRVQVRFARPPPVTFELLRPLALGGPWHLPACVDARPARPLLCNCLLPSWAST